MMDRAERIARHVVAEYEARWIRAPREVVETEPWLIAHITAALRSYAEPEWQPIETAPKDGTTILLWWPHWRSHPVVGYWYERSNAINKWSANECLTEGPLPIAWMPLPSPPTGDER